MKLALAVLVALCGTAGADASVTLRGGAMWHDMGWPRGTPILTIGSTRVVGKDEATTVKLAGGKQLVTATISIDGKDEMDFVLDLREGHHYTIEADPCCFLVVGDADDGLASTARCARGDTCPAGTIEIDRFVYRLPECGERPTCGAPALLRVRGGDVTIEWDGSEQVAWTDKYRWAPVGREHPQAVIVRKAGKIAWQGRLVLHHHTHYTLDMTGAAPRFLVDD